MVALVKGNFNSEKYIQILDKNLWPVIASHFLDGGYTFQDDNATSPLFEGSAEIMYVMTNQISRLEHHCKCVAFDQG